MKAIFKRELKAYFASPVGYVVVAALLALYGFFYYQVMMIGSSSYISQVFGTMFTFCMMIIPIITMRSMSDERKNKTDQALLTAPVSVTAIVLGKFFAAFGVYFVANALALLPAFAISLFATAFPWGIMIGNFIGTLLYGAAMIAIGVFISSLTISQVIAAIGTFAISVFLCSSTRSPRRFPATSSARSSAGSRSPRATTSSRRAFSAFRAACISSACLRCSCS